MDPTEIIPGLWMGGEGLLPLPADGFDAVVSLREVPDIHLPGIEEAIEQASPVFLWLPLIDMPVVPPLWKLFAASAFIDSALHAGRKTFVHCKQGHNRSGLVVCHYLVTKRGMDASQAILLVRQKRPGALSNAVFVQALKDLEI